MLTAFPPYFTHNTHRLVTALASPVCRWRSPGSRGCPGAPARHGLSAGASGLCPLPVLPAARHRQYAPSISHTFTCSILDLYRAAHEHGMLTDVLARLPGVALQLQAAIDHIAEDLLQLDLSHLRGAAIAAGDATQTHNFLEVVDQLYDAFTAFSHRQGSFLFPK